MSYYYDPTASETLERSALKKRFNVSFPKTAETVTVRVADEVAEGEEQTYTAHVWHLLHDRDYEKSRLMKATASSVTVDEDGTYWQEYECEYAPLPAEPTEEEQKAAKQAEMTDAIQKALDDFAKTRNYDGILSACSYATSSNTKFAAEAAYCVQLRDETWAMGYDILAAILAGEREIPTAEQLIAELPVGSAQWPDIVEG